MSNCCCCCCTDLCTDLISALSRLYTKMVEIAKIYESTGFSLVQTTYPALRLDVVNKKNPSFLGYYYKMINNHGWMINSPKINQRNGYWDGLSIGRMIKSNHTIPIDVRDGRNAVADYNLSKLISMLRINTTLTMFGNKYDITDIKTGRHQYLHQFQFSSMSILPKIITYDASDNQSIKDLNIIKMDNGGLLGQCLEKMKSHKIWRKRFETAQNRINEALNNHQNKKDGTPEFSSYPVFEQEKHDFGGVNFTEGADTLTSNARKWLKDFAEGLNKAVRDFDWKDVHIEIGFKDDVFDRDTVYDLITAFKPANDDWNNTSVNPNNHVTFPIDDGVKPDAKHIVDTLNEGGENIVNPDRQLELIYCYNWKILGKEKIIHRIPLEYTKIRSYVFTQQITTDSQGKIFCNYTCRSALKEVQSKDLLTADMDYREQGGYRVYFVK